MKGREGKAAPSADLLVCFPSRAHLTLMPKPICSPARPSEPSKRHQHHHHQHHHHHPHHLKKSSTRNGGQGQASPLLWAKTKPMGSEISEPTSPKVTCAGQIKVRHKTGSCKNWQSVMEEIERIHNKKKHKKRPAWVEALGFKKEIMQFLTCLRSIRFDFRCFGSIPESGITSDDEEEEDGDQYQDNQVGGEESDDNETSRTIFSKWFMVLQENQSCGFNKEEIKEKNKVYGEEESAVPPAVPPPNALLLMRCRSAPTKSWLEENGEEKEKEKEKEKEAEQEKDQQAKKAMLIIEEENTKKKENLVVMKYNDDFYKFSSDIAKETWVVGGGRDPLSRSRSWKR